MLLASCCADFKKILWMPGREMMDVRSRKWIISCFFPPASLFSVLHHLTQVYITYAHPSSSHHLFFASNPSTIQDSFHLEIPAMRLPIHLSLTIIALISTITPAFARPNPRPTSPSPPCSVATTTPTPLILARQPQSQTWSTTAPWNTPPTLALTTIQIITATATPWASVVTSNTAVAASSSCPPDSVTNDGGAATGTDVQASSTYTVSKPLLIVPAPIATPSPTPPPGNGCTKCQCPSAHNVKAQFESDVRDAVQLVVNRAAAGCGLDFLLSSDDGSQDGENGGREVDGLTIGTCGVWGGGT